MKIKKKILIFVIVIVLILFGVSFTSWFRNVQNIRKKVLSKLQKDLEFCQILKDNISLPKGKFWLICNGIPFYATYENGKVSYELNGWGFLKNQSEILDELQKEECNFYDLSDKTLTFICKSRKTKIYEFSSVDFTLKKIDEIPSLEQLSGIVEAKYDCSLSGESIFEMNGETFLKLTGKCRGKETKLAFSLDKRYFSLPIVMQEELSNKEKAEFSLQLLNVCKRNFVQDTKQGILLGMDCNLGKPSMSYDFEVGFANFLIKESELEIFFPYLGQYNLQGMTAEKLKYIKSEEKNNDILKYFLAKDKVIVAKSSKGSGLISEISFKNEGL